MGDMRISGDGISFIANYERLRTKAYNAGENDGILTIGYGHRDSDLRLSSSISAGGARDLLIEDLSRFERAVNSGTNVDLTQAQFDSLVALSFNIGDGAFLESNTLKQVNQGDFEKAAYEWAEWRNVNGKVNGGLVARRNDEIELFQTGDYQRHYNYYDRVSGKTYNTRTKQWESYCFPSHTLISTSNGNRPISELRIGDLVWAYDAQENRGLGELALKRVTRLYRNVTKEWVKLSWVENREQKELISTPGHHFLDEFGQFPAIEEMIQKGKATVVLASGALTEVTAERIIYSVETAHLFEQAQNVGMIAGNTALAPTYEDAWATYNFEVEDFHTYIAEGVRVHNQSGLVGQLGDSLDSGLDRLSGVRDGDGSFLDKASDLINAGMHVVDRAMKNVSAGFSNIGNSIAAGVTGVAASIAGGVSSFVGNLAQGNVVGGAIV